MAEEVVGRGVIELVGDARKLRGSIEEAKKSLRTLGDGQKDISKSASASIDQYIGKLQQQNATLGKSARETELFKLAMRGASNEQIKAADGALRMAENQARNAQSLTALRTGFIALGAAVVAGTTVAALSIDHLIKKAGDFQDIAEKIGDSGSEISKLAVAAAVGGVSMEGLTTASVRLTKGLTGVDDESKAAGAAIEALGLNLEDFKKLTPTEQLRTAATALESFADGSEKTAVAVALFGKSGAELLPFLKELANETEKQSGLTEEQIRLADEYSDSQKRFSAQISITAQAFAAGLIPTIVEFKSALLDLVKGITISSNSAEALNTIFNASMIVFKAAIVLISDVAFVFHAMGREIGAVSAQLVALSRLDLQGFRAISDAVKEDGVRARAELDKFQARILALGNAGSQAGEQFRDNFDKETQGKQRPRLNFSGALKKDKDGGDEARSLAAAQLQFDLDEIRKASGAQIAVLASSERILQAMRSANLVDDKNYFAAKLGFIQLNAREQEEALDLEIARLRKETFEGKNADKDRLERDRKVNDAIAKKNKLAVDTVANVRINSIEEQAANTKIAQSYVEATAAAREYIETIERRNARERAGIGQGSRFRETQAGLSDIDERLRQARSKIQGELRRDEIKEDVAERYLKIAADTYEKEVALYRENVRLRTEAEKDWLTGAREALANYADEAQNVAKNTEDVFTRAFKGLEDVIAEFSRTGKLNLKSLIDSISQDLLRNAVKEGITGPLAELLKGSLDKKSSGGGDFFSSVLGAIGGLFKFDVGVSRVPRDMIAKIHRGERILTADENERLNSGRGGKNVSINMPVTFNGPQDPRSVSQALAEGGRRLLRAVERTT